LSGCTLIDQRTFRAVPASPGAEELAHATLPPLPLLVVRFGLIEIDQAAIAQAVDLARARRADPLFDVVVPVAADVSAAAVRQAQDDAERVATALVAAGVTREHIVLGLRGDAGAAAREVRVYVR
jgi:hypothetical protein